MKYRRHCAQPRDAGGGARGAQVVTQLDSLRLPWVLFVVPGIEAAAALWLRAPHSSQPRRYA